MKSCFSQSEEVFNTICRRQADLKLDVDKLKYSETWHQLPELSYNDMVMTYLIFWSFGNIRLRRMLNIVEIGAIRYEHEGYV